MYLTGDCRLRQVHCPRGTSEPPMLCHLDKCLELIKLQGDQDLAAIGAQMQAIVAEAQSADPWTSRARPSFLYVMYAMILWAIPMGLIAAVDPKMALGIGNGMTAYLRGLPEELYALFGTGYLGYTAARTWGKAKGIER